MPVRLAAVLLAALAFLPVVPAHAAPADARRAAPPEVADRIVAAWKMDKVYVDERLRPAMPASELSRIRAAAARTGFPVYVALVPQTPYLRGVLYDLPTLLQARTGQPGLYVIEFVSDDYWFGVEELYRPGGLKGKTLTSVKSDDKQRLDIVDDRPAPQVVRTIQQAQTAYDGRPLPPVTAGDLEPERPERGMSVTDKEDRSVYIGLGIGGFLGFVLTLFLALRRRKRRPAASDSNAYVAEIRRQADSWINRAEQALKRLEKRSDPTLEQLDRRDDARRRLDAARQLPEDDLLSVAGALVLARQAEQSARGSRVMPPCFFDPTHKSGTTQVDWDNDVQVPACKPCAARLAKGETPRGLRVTRRAGAFGRDRESVPYWTLDPEDSPMVATGFGALSDDLAERIDGRLQMSDEAGRGVALGNRIVAVGPRCGIGRCSE